MKTILEFICISGAIWFGASTPREVSLTGSNQIWIWPAVVAAHLLASVACLVGAIYLATEGG